MKKRFIFLFSIILTVVIISSLFATTLAAEPVSFDNNGDGKVTVADYHLLEKYLAGYNPDGLDNFKVENCDYNGDGEVNFLDLNRLGNSGIYERYSPRY